MRLLLIRHGQTPANVAGELATAAPGPGLTDRGVEQAAAIPAALADQPLDAIYVSTLLRTHLTAAPLVAARGLAPIEDAGFREIEAGSLEGRTDKAAYAGYIDPVYEWVKGDRDARIEGGPNGHEFFARYDAAVARVAASGVAVAAVVSHGAAIRVWACATDPTLDGDYVSNHHLDNTGIVTLEGSPEEGWRVVSWISDPIGGETPADRVGSDPTGQA